MSSLRSAPSVRGAEYSAEIAHKHMSNNPQITITDFTGQAENAHIGFGANVGVDLFTTKNVARLSRKMEKKSGTLATDLPVFCTQDNNGYLYAQCDDGKILTSVDQGDTWSVLAGNAGTSGKGIIFWQGFLWSFFETGVDIYDPNTVTWYNNWTGFTGGNALVSQVGVNHYPLSGIVGSILDVCNEHWIARVEVIVFPFDPTNAATYTVDAKRFTMQDNYNAKVLGFLPTSNIAIGVENRLNKSQADIVIWDGNATTIATNIINLPGSAGAVTNLLTKNGTLYAVTTNDMGVYAINGSSATLVDRIGLRMTNRLAAGEQYTTRVQPAVRVASSDFLGPNLLIGACNIPIVGNQVTSSGLFPYGVWSVDVESKTVSTKFPLSHGDINALYSNNYEMGFVKILSNSKVIVGWRKGSTYGIDALNESNYITDSNTVFIESELLEVGTRITGKTFNNIVYNLVTPLLTGQQIEFYYRTSQSSDYTLFRTDTNATTGGETGNIISPLPFQQVKYIQLAVKLKADSGTANQTPQLDSIYLN